MYEYTFLPSARTASSSSRMPLRTRPHGLRMMSQVITAKITTSVQPTIRIHQSYALYVNGPKP